jgi:hypothetical protein
MFNRLLCMSLVLSIACKRDTLLADTDSDSSIDSDTAFDGGTDPDIDTDPGTDAPVDADLDGFTDDVDCDDTDADINPDADEVCHGLDDNCDDVIDTDAIDPITGWADADDDQFGDALAQLSVCELPDGYVDNSRDCDDMSAEVNPDADEVCNGIDDNCDGVIDDDAIDRQTGWADTDRDFFGDPAGALTQCSLPRDYVFNSDDCGPNDSNVNPNAIEVCNGIDDNCSGVIDDVDILPTFYADFDRDTYGDPNASTSSCIQPRGFVPRAGDCAPDDGTINPEAIEICDLVDNNCNGIVDTDTPVSELPTWYRDIDRDLFGDPNEFATACVPPGRDYVQNNTDCDPTNNAINPRASEVCNGLDDNCDLVIDTDAIDRPTWYADSDRDTFGDPSTAVEVCIPPGLDYVQNDGDCNPRDSTINPNAVEICDSVDNDCSGLPNDNEAIGSAGECAVQDCWNAQDQGLASGPTWVYWGQRTPFEVYCEQEIDGGGWALVFKNHGGGVPGEQSNSALLEGEYSGSMIAPHTAELVSDVNSILWGRVRGETGLQFLKMGTLYTSEGVVEERTTLRVSFNSNTWNDILAAPSSEACTEVDTPFVVIANGTTPLGSTTFINSYQSGRNTFGLANAGHGTDDSCRQDIDNLIYDPTETGDVLPRLDGGSSMNGIRHIFSYVHGARNGRDHSRCQFACWDAESFGGYYDGFTWGVRAPRR